MPIPEFDHNHVLPPHLGNPTIRSQVSPYPTNTLCLVERFATSAERIQILKGYLSFRKRLNELKIIDGFQWLDGSFLENIEATQQRHPNDLDLVTFYFNLPLDYLDALKQLFPAFVSPQRSKEEFKLDHYGVDFGFNPMVTVEQTRYWIQLFSHRRGDMVWKGMLRIELNTPDLDEQALAHLDSFM